jgi:hypothetical protein
MWMCLAVCLAVVGIYLVVRPMLHAMPRFKAFYDEADTIWQKAFALAYRSATVVVSYVGAAIGFGMNQLDTIAKLVGDPGFQGEVSKVIGADTRVLGGVLLAFSIIVFASRMRSIVNGG